MSIAEAGEKVGLVKVKAATTTLCDETAVRRALEIVSAALRCETEADK